MKKIYFLDNLCMFMFGERFSNDMPSLVNRFYSIVVLPQFYMFARHERVMHLMQN